MSASDKRVMAFSDALSTRDLKPGQMYEVSRLLRELLAARKVIAAVESMRQCNEACSREVCQDCDPRLERALAAYDEVTR